MEKNGDIYLDEICRLVLGARRGLLRRGRDHARTSTRSALGPQTGTPVEWVEEESYFFKLSAYQEKLLDLYAQHPDFVLPKERLNEVASFVQRRPAGPVDLAHHLRLGHPRARQPQAHHVCVGRRADQLHHRGRLSRHRQREIQALLAGRPARDRQGHRALPRGLLAGLPDVGRASRCRAASSRTASCSTAARRCRSRSAT